MYDILFLCCIFVYSPAENQLDITPQFLLHKIGRCYGMEINVKKTKVVRISRQPFPFNIMIDQKQLENVESFKYLGSILTNDGR